MRDHVFATHPMPAGSLLAVATLPIHAVLPLQASEHLAAGILALIGGAYVGFGAADGRLSRLIVETLIAVSFAIFAMAALATAPWVLPVGYILHGAWDAAHHWIDAKLPRWYIPACAVIDVLAGLGLWLVWWFL